MSKHHRNNNHTGGQNKTSPGSIGKFLSNIDINQLTSLLSSVDINQISSLVSKFGKGNQNESKASTAVSPDKTFANAPITLASLQSLGVLNKEELNSLLSRVKAQMREQGNGENKSDSSEEEEGNEV